MQVFNLTTYPHLVGLFSELGVESERSDMSFALSTDDVEWGSLGLKAVFAQKKNLVSPSFLNMIREILKFGKRAPEVLDPSKSAKYESMTLGEYLTMIGYSKFFIDNYVVPMCAAIWSCSDRDTMAFPVTTLIRFWVNHHLLNIIERPLWRVVKGRSKAYVNAVCAALPDVRTSTPVIAVERVPGGVKVTHAPGDRGANLRRRCSRTSSSPATPTRPSPSSATPRPPRRRPRWVPSSTSPTRCTFTATGR